MMSLIVRNYHGGVPAREIVRHNSSIERASVCRMSHRHHPASTPTNNARLMEIISLKHTHMQARAQAHTSTYTHAHKHIHTLTQSTNTRTHKHIHTQTQSTNTRTQAHTHAHTSTLVTYLEACQSREHLYRLNRNRKTAQI